MLYEVITLGPGQRSHGLAVLDALAVNTGRLAVASSSRPVPIHLGCLLLGVEGDMTGLACNRFGVLSYNFV